VAADLGAAAPLVTGGDRFTSVSCAPAMPQATEEDTAAEGGSYGAAPETFLANHSANLATHSLQI
jgi:hypothetical protein